jgi:1-acyl-sn-glycerol-3-phosphate acyltransferase
VQDLTLSSPLELPIVDTEALRRRLSRRGRSFLIFTGALALFVGLAPIWLPLGLLVEGVSRGRTTLVRGLSYLALFFAIDLTCVVAAFTFDALRLWPGVTRERWLSWHYALQAWWSVTLLGAAGRLFRLRFEVEGAEDVLPGPVVVLVRHVSVGDTLLPLAFVSGRNGFRFRYVIKHELLWDPCLDVVGNRIPNVFVRRGSDDSEREVRRIERLAERMGSSEGVVIYPEGTRFTPEKRRRVLEKLEEKLGEQSGGRALLDAQKRLEHVLVPRMAGALAALDGAPDADLVLCAHTGLEGLTTLRDLLAGDSSDRRVSVRFWRVPREEIPAGDDERVAFLLDRWADVDRFIKGHFIAGASARS